MQDVAAIMALSAESTASSGVYHAVKAIAADTVGWRLFTVPRYVGTVQAVERLYSSDEKAYPWAAARAKVADVIPIDLCPVLAVEHRNEASWSKHPPAGRKRTHGG
jgi:hypothetical protein